ncbi:high frequency lysogenization protein HflD [Thalassotalea sp. ND16A]|uniref:high frequency lysogenization protein HflD n=1 Tax=Thalassotalea sp. ND16A TaxID=1535422 RepID=UPI00051A2191|nr:high frequency lysogenization protein HflD [Thalassotalea sp. ND16A]
MSIKDQTLTFAAICQAAFMVQGIARKNHCDDELLKLMLSSITNTNPANPLDVYGNDLANLKDGLLMIVAQLGDNNPKKDPELTRYIVSLLNLERRLKSKSQTLAELGARIEQCKRQLDHYDLDSVNMLNSMASIYTDIISPLAAKIQIAGEPDILKQVGNQHRIRSLLLSGVRATVLWRQMGGKRRTILFNRRKIVVTAQEFLKQI